MFGLWSREEQTAKNALKSSKNALPKANIVVLSPLGMQLDLAVPAFYMRGKRTQTDASRAVVPLLESIVSVDTLS